MITTQEAYNFLARFWPHHPIEAKTIVEFRRVGQADGWLEAVRSGMAGRKARNDSEEEIRRCLEGCVCGELLVHLAVYLRDSGYPIWIALQDETGLVEDEDATINVCTALIDPFD